MGHSLWLTVEGWVHVRVNEHVKAALHFATEKSISK